MTFVWLIKENQLSKNVATASLYNQKLYLRPNNLIDLGIILVTSCEVLLIRSIKQSA